jgi:hypothetical protein
LKSPYFHAFIYFLFLYLIVFGSASIQGMAAAWAAAAWAASPEMAGVSHHD